MDLDQFTFLTDSEIKDAKERVSYMESLCEHEDLRYPGVHEWYSYRLYLESIDNYARGNFLSTIIISLAFIENTLGTLTLEPGSDKRGAYEVIEQSVDDGHISRSNAELLHQVRKKRNPVVHTRGPTAEDSYFQRYLSEDGTPYEIAVEDAKECIECVFLLVNSFYED